MNLRGFKLHGHVDVLLFFCIYQLILHSILSSADFSPPEKFVFPNNQVYLKRVKRFGSRSGPTFCRAYSGFKLHANVSVDDDKSKVLIQTHSLVEKFTSESL